MCLDLKPTSVELSRTEQDQRQTEENSRVFTTEGDELTDLSVDIFLLSLCDESHILGHIQGPER